MGLLSYFHPIYNSNLLWYNWKLDWFDEPDELFGAILDSCRHKVGKYPDKWHVIDYCLPLLIEQTYQNPYFQSPEKVKVKMIIKPTTVDPSLRQELFDYECTDIVHKNNLWSLKQNWLSMKGGLSHKSYIPYTFIQGYSAAQVGWK